LGALAITCLHSKPVNIVNVSQQHQKALTVSRIDLITILVCVNVVLRLALLGIWLLTRASTFEKLATGRQTNEFIFADACALKEPGGARGGYRESYAL
jgi:hypothetical protein